MSYHSVLGAGFSASASGQTSFTTASGRTAATPTTAPKPTVTLYEAATANIPKPTAAPATAAPAPIPTPQAVKYGTLLWSDTHAIAPSAKAPTYTAKPAVTRAVVPGKDYTVAPVAQRDYEAAAAAAQASASRQAGMNWLPWALGAAGIIGIVWLVRRRA